MKDVSEQDLLPDTHEIIIVCLKTVYKAII